MAHLTPAQLLTLKSAIAAETDPTFVALRATNDETGMAAWFNANSTFVVFKKRVPSGDIGLTINYVALAAMTDANQGQLVRFLTLNPVSFDPAKPDVRSFFANTFGGALGGAGQATRDAIEALYRRLATRVERVFATGAGSTADPGLLVFEGTIDAQHISDALRA